MAIDPRLISSQALAKALALEQRVNGLAGSITPTLPTVLYAAGTTVVTQTAPGSYTWTVPAGVTSAKIECWGAGAGGGGGSSGEGGEGGGGGEYACEPNYPVNPGDVLNYVVGNGGTGGVTFQGGNGGGDSDFDQSSVFANGGNAGSAFSGGFGGSGSTNTVVFSGGNGGGDGTQGTGGCGAGGSAGSSGAGFSGNTSTSSTGVGGGAGGSGTSGGGGGGGSAGANGVNGLAPGGGGGGAGAAAGSGQGSSTYRFTGSYYYYGSDATGGNANNYAGSGTMYQGGETASGGSYNGTMKSVGVLPSSVASDLSGVTIDSISLRTEWLHTWYNNGAYVILGCINSTNLGGSWDGGGIAGVKTYWQTNVGQPQTQDLTSTGLGAALKAGTAKSLSFGPGSPGFDLYNYGYFYGAGGDNSRNPLLYITWHTGSAQVQAGAGHDGRVQITYTNTSGAGSLQSALQPVAGADDSSNAFAAGYTGPVAAFQPASSPTAVETWHSLSITATGWSGTFKYRLTPGNEVQLSIFHLQNGPGPSSYNCADGTVIGTLPLGYRPAGSHEFPIAADVLGVYSGSNNKGAKLDVGSNGNITCYNLSTANQFYMAAEVCIPLDF